MIVFTRTKCVNVSNIAVAAIEGFMLLSAPTKGFFDPATTPESRRQAHKDGEARVRSRLCNPSYRYSVAIPPKSLCSPIPEAGMIVQ